MKDGDTIDVIFGRMQVLLNGLEFLGKCFSEAQVYLKLVR